MTKDTNHRLRNSVNFRSFSGNQIAMLLTLCFNLFPKTFLKKDREGEGEGKTDGRKECRKEGRK